VSEQGLHPFCGPEDIPGQKSGSGKSYGHAFGRFLPHYFQTWNWTLPCEDGEDRCETIAAGGKESTSYTEQP